MAPDYKNFLATEIVSEQKTVSYRNVSRALKVHVNAAKCMLFEFYEKENKKKPGSIYATYLIAGKKRQVGPASKDGTPASTNGHAPMPSSPPPFPSSLPSVSQATEQLEERYTVPIKTITLCREKQLDQVRDQYEQISSIHIYSLSPVHVQDLATLTETGRSVFIDYHSKQDPLIHNKDYGIIQNPHVWRRSGRRPVNVEAQAAQPKLDTKKPAPLKKEDSTPAVVKEVKQEQKAKEASRPSSRDSTSTQDSKKPNLKRDGSSLFKAFAKQPARPRPNRQDSKTSVDAEMGGMDANDDEGESEDEAMFLDTGTTASKSKKRPSELRKEKEEREAKLRKMMEDEEGAVADAPRVDDAADLNADPPAAKAGEGADVQVDDVDNVDWSDSDGEKSNKPANQEQEAPKRRRGKRKVMKKKTIKDEDGYLVTREEEAWESFSEDEPDVKPAAKLAFPAKRSGLAAKSQTEKGAAPKSGGGAAAGTGKKKDIMSFFGKK